MADPVKMIEDDHRKVEQLFQQYTSSKDPKTLDEICAELTVHAALEEQHLYPLMAREVPDGDKLRQEGEQEHQEVKDIVAELESLGFEGDGVEQLATQLQQSVEHHVQEEESEMLPKLRERLDEQKLTQLAETLAQAKQQAMEEMQANLAKGGSSGTSVEGELTKEELYQKAKEQDIEGRSKMDKEELKEAVEQQ
jgi:hemerythrin superfamily protein